MINYETEYLKATQKIKELDRRTENQTNMLREMAGKIVKKDAEIEKLMSVDNRTCIAWKLTAFGLGVLLAVLIFA